MKEKRKSIIRNISESGGSESADINGITSDTPIPEELPEEAVIS